VRNVLFFIAAKTFFPIFILMGIVYSMKDVLTIPFWNTLSEKIYKSATLFSQLGNVWMKELLNDVCVTKDGTPYGDEDDSISDITGRNQRDGTLTKTGIGLAKFLNLLGKDHALESIDE
jgi:hypothetical protein